MILILILFVFFFFNQVHPVEPHKLLIPGEKFRNSEQKQYEISNFKKSGISYFEWRKRKCYKQNFVLFQRSNLCYHDPHFCAQDYAVDEMHFFHKYRRWLMEISEVCAEGYYIDEKDTEFIKQPLEKEVIAFKKYIRETKRIVNYNNTSSNQVEVENEISDNKTRLRKDGAHGAVPVPNNKKKAEIIDTEKIRGETEIKKRKKDLEEEEKKILLEKKILESELEIIKKKKELEKLKSEIEEFKIN